MTPIKENFTAIAIALIPVALVVNIAPGRAMPPISRACPFPWIP